MRFLFSDECAAALKKIVAPLRNRSLDNGHKVLTHLQSIERLGENVLIYPDAEAYLERLLFRERIQTSVYAVRRDPANHALRNSLLKVPLLPYQLDGIAFCVGAGRAVLADEMGLGKTIKGIGVAEWLAREAGIERVLVITPASVKSQWRNEISKLCSRDSQIVVGSAQARAEQYQNSVFLACAIMSKFCATAT
ncbi:MAG: SNF2 family DNA or RNA helicase [Lentisphaeria bacterium]